MDLNRTHIHSGEKQSYSCSDCPKQFLYRKNLLRHQRKKHLQNGGKNKKTPYKSIKEREEKIQKNGDQFLTCYKFDEPPVKKIKTNNSEEIDESLMDEEETDEEIDDDDSFTGGEDEVNDNSGIKESEMDILNLKDHPDFDESIESMVYHSHYPYANTKLDAGEEIRIPVQLQDIHTLPSASFIYLELSFTKEDGRTAPAAHTLINNAFPFLFDEIRYEICGSEIDKVRNPGIASTLKGLTSFNVWSYSLSNMGWIVPFSSVRDEPGVTRFNACLPLSLLLGFAEDYRKILINVKQELILVRARSDANCYTQHVDDAAGERVKINLHSLCWKIPYVSVNELQRLTLINYLKSEKIISLHYRAWDMHEYPLLPASNRQVWSIKTSTQLEKPRFVILAFQTGRNNIANKPSSVFDHCDLTNVKLYLNSRVFPYDDLNLKFSENRYSLLYQMYASFQTSYYNSYQSFPYVTFSEFKDKSPLVVIDCSKQSEYLKTGPVDVRLEFESEKNFPLNTTAYCLIIHDRFVQYNPLTSVVHKMT